MRVASAGSGWAVPVCAGILVFLLGAHPEDDRVPRLMVQAQSAARHGLHGESLEDLEAMLAFDPALAALHLPAAELALRAGQPERALTHLDAADHLLPADDLRSCKRMEAMLQAGDWTSAETLWSTSQGVCQGDAALIHHWVEDLWDRNAYLEASGFLDALQASTASTDVTSLDLRRAALADVVFRPERAASSLRRALAALSGPDPLLAALAELDQPSQGTTMAPYYASVGGALANAEEWGLAREALQRALAEEPNLAVARAYLGMAIQRMGEPGWGQILAALLTDPSSSAVWTIVGDYRLERGDATESLHAYQQAARLDSNNAAAAAGMGAALATMGRIDEAIEAYTHATELAPSDPRFWMLLSRLSLRLDFDVHSVGLPAARNAVAQEPENPSAWAALGYAHVLAGEPRLGLRLILTSIDIGASDPETYYHLGLAYLALGDHPGAEAALEAAVELDPQGPIGEIARRTLEALRP